MSDQAMAALELANEVRLARASVKRALKTGEMTVAGALRDPAVASMRVIDLLCALRYWGPVRVPKLLRRQGIGMYRLVGDLTVNERARLAGAIDEGWNAT